MHSLKNLRVIGIVVACVVLTASGVWNSGGEPTKARAEEVKDAKLKQLLTERLETLKEVAAFATRLYGNARVSFDQVRAANQAMYNAELDLCETDKERVQILEKMLITATQYEQVAAAAKVSAQGTDMGVLKAKADRLDVEIALYRVKAK